MNNLKEFNTEFQCTLSVDALAEKLLSTIYPKNVWIKEYITVEIETIACGVKTDLLDGKDETDASDIRDFCIEYLKNLAYHIRLVESIIDGIKDNSESCSNVFNSLHGWVKLPTPTENLQADFDSLMDENDKIAEKLTIQLREEIGDGWNDSECVQIHEMDFNSFGYNTKWFDFNMDYFHGVIKGKFIYIPYITDSGGPTSMETKIKKVSIKQCNYAIADTDKLKNYIMEISSFMLKYSDDEYI
jgi:hypothetical protein